MKRGPAGRHEDPVTGGAGFIGSHLVDALVAGGHEVRVLDDLSSGTRTNLARHLDAAHGRHAIELIEGDVRDPAAARRAVEGCAAVFHGAAIVSVARSIEEPELVESVNAGGTLTVLEAARAAGARRLVFASSCAVYGDPPTLPVAEDAATDPLSPYAAAKLTAEEHCRRFAAAGDLETVCLRYFNVFGPRQDPSSEYSGVIARFIDCALAGRELTVFGDGKQTRDFVFVADVVRANVLALTGGSRERVTRRRDPHRRPSPQRRLGCADVGGRDRGVGRAPRRRRGAAALPAGAPRRHQALAGRHGEERISAGFPGRDELRRGSGADVRRRTSTRTPEVKKAAGPAAPSGAAAPRPQQLLSVHDDPVAGARDDAGSSAPGTSRCDRSVKLTL